MITGEKAVSLNIIVSHGCDGIAVNIGTEGKKVRLTYFFIVKLFERKKIITVLSLIYIIGEFTKILVIQIQRQLHCCMSH